MDSYDDININLLDSNVEVMTTTFHLKVSGISEHALQYVADRMNLQRTSSNDAMIHSLTTKFQEFGSDKRQTVLLLAAATIFYHQSPTAKMSLHGQFTLEPQAPLILSAAAQLYFSQAGFAIQVMEQDRILNPQEMDSLHRQFQSFARARLNRGA